MKALLARGLRVTMLDAGLDLEDRLEEHRRRMAATSPAQWPRESASVVKVKGVAEAGGVPLKRVHGSDFPFRVPVEAAPIRQDATYAVRSFARGGLSRAWGSTLLPFAASDIANWPISVDDLEPHYRAVMKWVPLSAVSDGLDRLFPMYCDTPGVLKPSRQAQGLLDALASNRAALDQLGATFGQARLAVQSHTHSPQAGCVYCGLCLYGCPYGSIYSADQQLAELKRDSNFSYRDGVVVVSVRETANEVEIVVANRGDRATTSLRGDRVFLACGVLTTSQLLMDALRVNEVSIHTSQSFLMPLIKKSADLNIRADDAHALTQIYILLSDPQRRRRLIQLQIYTYSDLLSEALDDSVAGPAFRLMPRLKRMVEDRLVVMQGLLPSEESDVLRLRKSGNEFVLSGAVSAETRERVVEVARATRAIGALGGFRPLVRFLRISAPGQSFHSGSSFPMSSSPRITESDRLGRPGGLTRIHAVDATVLPDVPAPPLTLTVMANAHRIGTHA